MAYTQSQINLLFKLFFKGNENLFEGLTRENLTERLDSVARPFWNVEIDRPTMLAEEFGAIDFNHLISQDAIDKPDDLNTYPQYATGIVVTWKNEAYDVLNSVYWNPQTSIDAFLATL